jgi:hypothetical protein
MGLEAIYHKPRLSLASQGRQIYLYPLRGVKVTWSNFASKIAFSRDWRGCRGFSTPDPVTSKKPKLELHALFYCFRGSLIAT